MTMNLCTMHFLDFLKLMKISLIWPFNNLFFLFKNPQQLCSTHTHAARVNEKNFTPPCFTLSTLPMAPKKMLK
jgi:hypothetical protein